MQFIRDQLFDATNEEVCSVDSTERELDPGVILRRRTAFRFGLGALTTLLCMSPMNVLGQEVAGESEKLNDEAIELETLIARLRPEARRMISSDVPDEEVYIKRAIEELTKLTELETNRFGPPGSPIQSDYQAWVFPVSLYQFRMEPNSVIHIHDHRDVNGAISVREGSARIRSFDIFEEEGEKRWDVLAGKLPEKGEEFLIQEKGDVVLKERQGVGLTRTRDNFHQVEAGPDGCLLYDLFTYFKLSAAGSHRVAWDGKHFDPNRKLCKVTWFSPDHEKQESKQSEEDNG